MTEFGMNDELFSFLEERSNLQTVKEEDISIQDIHASIDQLLMQVSKFVEICYGERTKYLGVIDGLVGRDKPFYDARLNRDLMFFLGKISGRFPHITTQRVGALFFSLKTDPSDFGVTQGSPIKDLTIFANPNVVLEQSLLQKSITLLEEAVKLTRNSFRATGVLQTSSGFSNLSFFDYENHPQVICPTLISSCNISFSSFSTHFSRLFELCQEPFIERTVIDVRDSVSAINFLVMKINFYLLRLLFSEE